MVSSVLQATAVSAEEFTDTGRCVAATKPSSGQGSGSFAIAKVSRNSRAHGDASSFPEPSG